MMQTSQSQTSQSEEEFLICVCDSSSRNDAAKVASLLGCRRIASPSLDEPLLGASRQAEVLRARVFRVIDTGVDSAPIKSRLPENIRPEHAARALLIAPTAYEVPWSAACEFVQYLHKESNSNSRSSLSKSFLRSSVADIQSFLQQTVAAWWEEERKQIAGNKAPRSIRPAAGEQLSALSPRQWIMRLVAIAMQPLYQESLGSESHDTSSSAGKPRRLGDNSHWTVPLELLPTICSLSRDLEASLLESCLNLVFQHPLRYDRILPWIGLASELRTFLRDDDWKALHQTLKRVLSGEPCPVHYQDLPGLSEGILSLCSVLVSNRNFQQDDLVPWKALVLRLLLVASGDLSTFSTVETILQFNLGTLPTAALQQWTAITDISTLEIPAWVQANMLLLVLRAVRHSGSQLVAKLVARALGGQNGLELAAECWNRLVLLTVGGVEYSNRQGSRTNINDSALATENLRRLLDGVSYSGRGRFDKRDGTEESVMTRAGTVVFQSIFLNHKQQPSAYMHVMERAQAWVHAATAAFETAPQGSQDSRCHVLALAVLVVVFCDVPMSRSSLTRAMFQSFTGETTPGRDATDAASLHCLAVAVMLKGTEEERFSRLNGGELDQITDVFSKQLRMSVFFDLARALSPLPSARQALLGAARKGLHAPFEADLWWSTGAAGRVTKENSDRTKCSLFALCTLVSPAEWGSLEVEAWGLLSDTIVRSKPPLPAPARAWLFSRLKGLMREQSLSLSTADHVLRACLVRFLSFLGSDQNGRVRFVPEKLFVVWRDGKEDSPSRSKQLDDVIGLLDLILALVYYIVGRASHGPRQSEGVALLSLWRIKLLSLIQSWQERQSLPTGQAVQRLDMDCIQAGVVGSELLLSTTIRCVLIILQFVLDHSFVLALPSANEMAVGLVSQEAKSLEDISEGPLPAWTDQPRHAIGACDPTTSHLDAAHVNSLRAACCDTIAEFIVGDRWSSDSDGDATVSHESVLKMSALGISSIVSSKRKLMASLNEDQRIIALQSCSAETVCGIFNSHCMSCLNFIEATIQEGGNVDLVDEAVAAILDLCKDLTRISGADSFDNGHRFHPQIVVLWELYARLCGEDSTITTISYLESQNSNWNATDVSSRDSYSLRSICSSHDIDDAVRHIRSTVLCTTIGYFSVFKRQQQCLPSPSIHESASSTECCELFVNFISALSRDLHVGLGGASGGLTSELFLLYADCIEVCSGILANYIPALNRAKEKISVSAECTKAALSLKNILCSVPLKGSTVFKKTMGLALDTLPSVSRRAVCSLLLDSKRGDLLEATSQHMFAVASLEQCLRSIYLSGKEITSNKDENDSDSGEPEDAGIRPVLPAADLSKGKRANSMDIGENLQLHSTKASSWACSSVFSAFEQTWCESYEAMMRSPISFRSPQGARAFYARRNKELEITLQSIASVFKTKRREDGPHEKSQSKRQNPLAEPLAVMLPAPAKLRLSATLDRILTVLQRGLKVIAKSFRGYVDFETTAGRLILVESLSCVAAWLNQTTNGQEITIGARSWYAAEKRQSALSQTMPTIHIAETSVLKRLPKIVLRIEELEDALLKTCQLFAIKGGTRKQRSIKALQDFQTTMTGPEDVNSAGADKVTSESLEAMLSGKVTFLEEQRAALAIELGEDSATQDGRSRKRKSIQEVERLVQKERRRKVVRSRNQTVDKWLQMDQTIGQDDGPDGDAYADLEDFLVDG